MKRWMQTAQPQFLGELFNQKGGDVKCAIADHASPDAITTSVQVSEQSIVQSTSDAAPTVQPVGAAKDVCRNRSRGNTESAQAFQAVKDRLSYKQELVWNCIKDSGDSGRTNDQICVILGLTPNQVSPRITELRIAGRIEKISTRLTRRNCSAAVWRAT